MVKRTSTAAEPSPDKSWLKPVPLDEIIAQDLCPKFTIVSMFLLNDTVKAPVSGNSHYIVLEFTKSKTTLFHPWTLTKFPMPTADFVFHACTPEVGEESMAKSLEKLAQREASLNREAPYKLLREMIAHFRQVPLEQVPEYKKKGAQ